MRSFPLDMASLYSASRLACHSFSISRSAALSCSTDPHWHFEHHHQTQLRQVSYWLLRAPCIKTNPVG
jgi:hypothetical protein